MLPAKKIVICSANDPKIKLRSININDIELLRQWKNDNRHGFFMKEVIQPEQQQRWFAQFCTEEHDYMFIVQYDKEDVGCMGFRLLDRQIDIYNVILGRKEFSERGIMSLAIQMMTHFILAKFDKKITARVLNSNPALKWYEKNGFKIIDTFDTYHLVQLLDKTCRQDVSYQLSEE